MGRVLEIRLALAPNSGASGKSAAAACPFREIVEYSASAIRPWLLIAGFCAVALIAIAGSEKSCSRYTIGCLMR